MASLGLLGALAGAGRGVEDYGKGRMSMALEDIKAERLAQAAEAERGFRREERQADRDFTASQSEADRGFRSSEAQKGRDFAGSQADMGRQHDLTRDERKAAIELERARATAGSKGPGWHEKERAKLVAEADSDYHQQVAEIMSDTVMTPEEKEDAIKARQIARQSRIATADSLHGGQSKRAPSGGGDGGGARIPPGTTKTIKGTAYIMKADGWHVDDGTTQDGPRKGGGQPAPEASTRPAPEDPSDYIKGVEERTRPAPRSGLIAGAQAATTEAPAQSDEAARPAASRGRRGGAVSTAESDGEFYDHLIPQGVTPPEPSEFRQGPSRGRGAGRASATLTDERGLVWGLVDGRVRLIKDPRTNILGIPQESRPSRR